jgi:putative redox protein
MAENMRVDVDHLENVKFSIEARGHVILCDQSEQDGGSDEGMTPPELLLASLASCAGYYAAQYLRSRKLAMSGSHVTVTADKVRNPTRLDNFKIEVTSPVALTADQLTGIERAVHLCLVHNTLLAAPTITTVVKVQDGVQVDSTSPVD